MYYTLQGEGYHSGRPAVFCRFAGCNLWSGLEKDRANAICKFCDTNFWGMDGPNGGKYTADQLASQIRLLANVSEDSASVFVVCTGGEPALQMDNTLIEVFHAHHIEVAIETNGTLELPDGIDWICVSPKADTEIIIKQGHELKLVFPQMENSPDQYESLQFDHFYLQPLDNPQLPKNIRSTIDYCLQHPGWKLSLQTHKMIGID